MSQHFSLEGQHAIVTGGARGIGLATCRRFLAAGATVTIADVNEEAAAAAVAELGAGARYHTVDVTDADQVDALVAGVMQEVGRLDAMVCCAAIVGRNAFAWETTPDEWRHALEINLTGVWLCNRAALGPMREADYGRIVNIASISGKEGNPKMGPYSASKAGVIGMTKSLAKEVADTGIRIHSVAPAVIQTPQLEQVTQETLDYMVSKIPVGRTGTVDEVAALIHYLCSPECSFSTGSCHDISGGRATY
jgi:NAD(P)-dependent dehydrogenase (short-subunit alcohol dehydrogenase family)